MNRRQSISFDDIDISGINSQVVPIISTDLTKPFENQDRALWNNYVNNIRETDITSQEICVIVNNLHGTGAYSTYIIGDMFRVIEQKIDKKEKPYNVFNSFNDWFNKNSAYISFNVQTAYKYMKIRGKLPEAIVDKIGMKKAYELSRITDDKVIKNIVNKITDNAPETETNFDEFKQLVKDVQAKAAEKRREVYEAHEEKIKAKLPDISLRFDENKNKRIILEFDTVKDRDIFNEIWDRYADRIKHDIMNRKEGK